MTPPHRTTERPTVVGSPTDATNMEPSPVHHNEASSTSPAPPPSAELVNPGYIDDVTTVDADAMTAEQKLMANVPVDEKAVTITVRSRSPADEGTAGDEKVTKTTTVAAAITEDMSLVSDIVVADEKVTTTAAQIVAVSVSDENVFFLL